MEIYFLILVPPDPSLVELEALVSRQMDKQLKILRDEITTKLRQVDDVLKKATGVQLPIDQFSLSVEPLTDADHHHKSDKKTPHQNKPPEKSEKAEAPAGKKKAKKWSMTKKQSNEKNITRIVLV